MYHRGLDAAVKPFCDKVRSAAEEGDRTCILTRLDADGLIAASIISMAFMRLGGKCEIRAIPEMATDILDNMKTYEYDFYIISALGASMGSMPRQAFGDSWMIIDDYQFPEKDLSGLDSERILSAYKCGMDGSSEISSGGLAYLLAERIEQRNWDLAPMAVVSALSDNQDLGDKKSLISTNSEICKIAESHGLIRPELDLILSGRQTRPIHEALALTSFPYTEGLTWNTDNSYAIIKNSGTKMMEHGRWRVFAELSQEEKDIILDAMVKYAETSKLNAELLAEHLVGFTYTLLEEDVGSPLRDAREFTTILDACVRLGKAGVGIGICMGDRNSLMNEAEEVTDSYRAILKKSVSGVISEKWRTADDGTSILLNAENLLTEELVDAAASLLSGSLGVANRVLVVWTIGKDRACTISCRKSLDCKLNLDLGFAVRNCAQSVDGIGGGHKAAASSRIPSSRLEEFLSCLRRAIIDSKVANSS
jgi:single-stranded-DNA-specific exonuclease